MRIGFDLDGVLCTNKHFINKIIELGYSPEQLTTYDFSYMKSDDVAAMLAWFESETFAKNVDVFPGSPEVVEALVAAGHDVFVVTARSPKIKKATLSWLRRHYPKIRNATLTGGDKRTVLEALHLDLFIDDYAKNLDAAASLGISCAMISNDATLYNHLDRARYSWWTSVADIDFSIWGIQDVRGRAD